MRTIRAARPIDRQCTPLAGARLAIAWRAGEASAPGVSRLTTHGSSPSRRSHIKSENDLNAFARCAKNTNSNGSLDSPFLPPRLCLSPDSSQLQSAALGAAIAARRDTNDETRLNGGQTVRHGVAVRRALAPANDFSADSNSNSLSNSPRPEPLGYPGPASRAHSKLLDVDSTDSNSDESRSFGGYNKRHSPGDRSGDASSPEQVKKYKKDSLSAAEVKSAPALTKYTIDELLKGSKAQLREKRESASVSPASLHPADNATPTRDSYPSQLFRPFQVYAKSISVLSRLFACPRN